MGNGERTDLPLIRADILKRLMVVSVEVLK